MFKNILLCGLVTLILVMASSAYAGKVELTTYYPAPFGEYQELQAMQAKLQPTDAPNECVSTLEGALYYDLSDHALNVCMPNGLGVFAWSPLSANPAMIELGTGAYNALTLPNTNKNLLTLGSVTSPHTPAIVWATTGPPATEITVNLSSFPSGFYEIEWGYNVSVTSATEARGVYLYLDANYGSGWVNRDSIFLEDENLTDGLPTTFNEFRAYQVSLSKRASVRFRIRALKNQSAVVGKVNSAYIKVFRM